MTLLFALLLPACSPAPVQTPQPEPTSSTEPTRAASAEAPTAPTSTAGPRPTPEPTATVWPPVFVFRSLQDIRSLDSFVLSLNEKNTVNGSLTEQTHTYGYIKEPYRAYYLNEYTGGMDRTYIIDDWTYTLTGSGDWYISAGADKNLFSRADIPGGNTGKLLDAKFVGEGDYQGIPAYHFVLDPVSTPGPGSSYGLEGDLELARDGNYVLRSHWKETSSQDNFSQVYEVTETLSSINQVTDIELPADMTEMAAAAKVPAEMGLPLPGDSVVDKMIRYRHGIGVDLYFLSHPKVTPDEFLDYYRNLPPTNDWEVTHVGHVSLHQDDCEFTTECVIINKGSTQVILYFVGGTVRAEFDWPHLYSPVAR